MNDIEGILLQGIASFDSFLATNEISSFNRCIARFEEALHFINERARNQRTPVYDGPNTISTIIKAPFDDSRNHKITSHTCVAIFPNFFHLSIEVPRSETNLPFGEENLHLPVAVVLYNLAAAWHMLASMHGKSDYATEKAQRLYALAHAVASRRYEVAPQEYSLILMATSNNLAHLSSLRFSTGEYHQALSSLELMLSTSCLEDEDDFCFFQMSIFLSHLTSESCSPCSPAA